MGHPPVHPLSLIISQRSKLGIGQRNCLCQEPDGLWIPNFPRARILWLFTCELTAGHCEKWGRCFMTQGTTQALFWRFFVCSEHLPTIAASLYIHEHNICRLHWKLFRGPGWSFRSFMDPGRESVCWKTDRYVCTRTSPKRQVIASVRVCVCVDIII